MVGAKRPGFDFEELGDVLGHGADRHHVRALDRPAPGAVLDQAEGHLREGSGRDQLGGCLRQFAGHSGRRECDHSVVVQVLAAPLDDGRALVHLQRVGYPTTAATPSQTTDPATRASVEMRRRLHAVPYLGSRSLASFQPSHIRLWVRALENTGLAAAYRRGTFAHVSTVLSAAVEDRIIRDNPCRSRSVKAPRLDPQKVKPWDNRVEAVRGELPDRYHAMIEPAAGCGLRQGAVFGLAVEEVDFRSGVVRVIRQVKLLRGQRVFAPPKGGKIRDVPLPGSVAFALADHMRRHPPVEITLPWKTPEGSPVTATLIFTSAGG